MRTIGMCFLVLLSIGPCAHAMQVAVSSEPPGAVVLASPLDEPVAYKKGITPCDVTLDDARGPHVLILSKTGHFPCYRTAAPGALHAVLPSRDDPASWQALRDSSAVPSPYELLPVTWTDLEVVAGIRTQHRAWAPDASGTLVNANPYAEETVALGLAKPGQERECSELWWMPWGGAPVLLWRYVTRSQYDDFPYWPDATFSPDPRWLVHSAPVGPRERLELHCLATGRKTTIAADHDYTLCCGVFSPDGRRIACLRWSTAEGNDLVANAEVQVMRWDGLERRTVATGVPNDVKPVFSPDGDEVAYMDAKGRVCTVGTTGGRPRVLIDGRGWETMASPAWSPDGNRLAALYVGKTVDGRGVATRLMWAGVDGGPVGHIPAVGLEGWHDNETFDVFARGYHAGAAMGYSRILRTDLAGRSLGVLRRPQWVPCGPEVSPDGSRLAVVAWRWEGQPAVAVIDTAALTATLRELPAGNEARRVGWIDRGALWVKVTARDDGSPGYRLSCGSGAVTSLAKLPTAPAEERFPSLRAPAHGVLAYTRDDTIHIRKGEGPGCDRALPVPGGWSGELSPTLPIEEAAQ